MSLYRKYRPQNFANLVGQDHVKITLTNALKSDNINHAYLFTGPRGTGKTSTARLLAKAVNCQNLQNAEPCEQCEICKDISEGRLIDIVEIDAASNRGIDEMRDLREKIQFAPTRAKNKVYIIDEVHMLTKEAFNALLKTLEEPPTHVYFILATTEAHKIPETILSRCQRFDFKRIDDKTLFERLTYIAETENIVAEKEALEEIAHTSQGGLRDAIGLLEQLSVDGHLTSAHVREILSISGKVSIEKLYKNLENQEVLLALEEIHAVYREGYDLSQLNKDFLEFLRQRLLASVKADEQQKTSKILTWISFFQESYESLKHTTIAQLPLEIAIIQSCYARKENLQPEAARENVPPTQPQKLRDQPQTQSAVQRSVEIPSQPISSPQVLPSEIKDLPLPTSHEKVKTERTTEISFEEVKAKWPQVSQHMKSATTRRILNTFKLKALVGNDLQVVFETQFHMGKMMETASRLDLEEAIYEVFQTQLKISPEIGKIEAAPQKDVEIAHADMDQTSKLLEVFGGEMMEG